MSMSDRQAWFRLVDRPMASWFRSLGLFKIAVLALCVAGFVSAPVAPALAHSTTIKMNIVQAGFVLGAGGGAGTVRYQGSSYDFTVTGVSVGFILGASAADISGTVHNLRRLSDINGTYFAVGAGGTLGVGGSVATLQNSSGVRLNLHAINVGLGYSLSLGGVHIRLR
jgi:hypothetical protein